MLTDYDLSSPLTHSEGSFHPQLQLSLHSVMQLTLYSHSPSIKPTNTLLSRSTTTHTKTFTLFESRSSFTYTHI